MISDFKNFPKNAFETAEFRGIVSLTTNFTPIILLKERGLSPESYFAFCYPRAGCL